MVAALQTQTAFQTGRTQHRLTTVVPVDVTLKPIPRSLYLLEVTIHRKHPDIAAITNLAFEHPDILHISEPSREDDKVTLTLQVSLATRTLEMTARAFAADLQRRYALVTEWQPLQQRSRSPAWAT